MEALFAILGPLAVGWAVWAALPPDAAGLALVAWGIAQITCLAAVRGWRSL
jgi:hypothetical protein